MVLRAIIPACTAESRNCTVHTPSQENGREVHVMSYLFSQFRGETNDFEV